MKILTHLILHYLKNTRNSHRLNTIIQKHNIQQVFIIWIDLQGV